jgi:hypothetical protein
MHESASRSFTVADMNGAHRSRGMKVGVTCLALADMAPSMTDFTYTPTFLANLPLHLCILPRSRLVGTNPLDEWIGDLTTIKVLSASPTSDTFVSNSCSLSGVVNSEQGVVQGVIRKKRAALLYRMSRFCFAERNGAFWMFAMATGMAPGQSI